MAPPVCSIDFGNFIYLDPGRSGSCSSWQCCRTQLVLQLCQLRHLLICHGLGDNHRSGYVSRALRCLNGSRARRRGRPATEQRRHLAPVHHLWPRSSAPNAAWPPRRQPGRSGHVHSLLPLTLSQKTRPLQSRHRKLTPASSNALLAALLSTKTRPQICRDLLSNLHQQTRRETLRWADISNFPQIGSSWPSSPANSMLSSSELFVFSS